MKLHIEIGTTRNIAIGISRKNWNDTEKSNLAIACPAQVWHPQIENASLFLV